MTPTVIGVSFGALAPPLHEQLRRFELPTKQLRSWQLDRDAINRLAIRGLLTESERDKADNRLFKQIVAKIDKP